VEQQHVHQFWSHVEKYLEVSQNEGMPYPESAKSYNIDHIRMYLASGQWMLLIAADEENKIHGAMTISFIDYPLHRIAFVTATGGKFITNEETLKQLKETVKFYGATKLQAYCRDSMVRYLKRLDFEPRNTLVETLV
jgi:hypothetical protein